jgi:trypsin
MKAVTLSTVAALALAGKLDTNSLTYNEAVKQWRNKVHSIDRVTMRTRDGDERRRMVDKEEPSPSIVNGVEVSGSTYPWISAFHIADYGNCHGYASLEGGAFCGGSYIGMENGSAFFLTAAHCMVDIQATLDEYNDYYGSGCDFHLYVDVSATDVNDADYYFEHEGGIDNVNHLEIDGIAVHSGYNDNTFENDIAMAYSTDVGQVSGVTAINLCEDTSCYTSGDAVRVLGYGADCYDCDPTDQFEAVDLEVTTTSACRLVYGENDIKAGMVCAYADNKDSCQGDSGGPLIKGTATDGPQVGVVSFGYKCAEPGFPGVYSDVGFYYDWILETKSDTNSSSWQNSDRSDANGATLFWSSLAAIFSFVIFA